MMIEPQHRGVLVVQLSTRAKKLRDLRAASRCLLPLWKRIQDRDQRGIRGRHLSAKRITRHKTNQRLPQRLSKSFISEVKKSPVAHNRTANTTAKLVEPER